MRKPSKTTAIVYSDIHVKKLKDQRRSLGLLQFEYSAERNFTKWESLTENLVINLLGSHSNQHNQYNDLISSFKYASINTQTFKQKMKDLLSNFIEELEMHVAASEEKSTLTRPSKTGTSIKIQNKQVAIQNVNISQTIDMVISKIKETEPDEQKIAEAEKK